MSTDTDDSPPSVSPPGSDPDHGSGHPYDNRGRTKPRTNGASAGPDWVREHIDRELTVTSAGPVGRHAAPDEDDEPDCGSSHSLDNRRHRKARSNGAAESDWVWQEIQRRIAENPPGPVGRHAAPDEDDEPSPRRNPNGAWFAAVDTRPPTMTAEPTDAADISDVSDTADISDTAEIADTAEISEGPARPHSAPPSPAFTAPPPASPPPAFTPRRPPLAYRSPKPPPAFAPPPAPAFTPPSRPPRPPRPPDQSPGAARPTPSRQPGRPPAPLGTPPPAPPRPPRPIGLPDPSAPPLKLPDPAAPETTPIPSAAQVPPCETTDVARPEQVQIDTPSVLDAPNTSERVRVVLSERKRATTPVRTVEVVQEGTGVGQLLRSSLIHTQLAVALWFTAAAGFTLGVLPLLFAVFPQIGRAEVFGLRVPWLLLGVLIYPFLLGLGWWHARTAERVEQNFADHVQD